VPEPLVLSTLADKVAPGHTALLVIDMVNDFVHPEGKTALRAGRDTSASLAVVPSQQRLRDAARAAGVATVLVQHTTLLDHASDSGPWLEARRRATFSVEDVCLDGTWGQEFLEGTGPVAGDLVVRKHRYSAFAGTNLDLLLRSRGIRTVVATGVSTNSCVEATAREAFSLDYYVVYVEDACASWDMDLHRATLASADRRYAEVTDTDAVVAAWSEETS
jgi:nicotinamidase-related amidase